MRNPTARRLAAFCIALVAAFGLLNVLAYNHVYAMMHFTAGGPRTHQPEQLSPLAKYKVLLTGVNIPRPVGNDNPSALSSNCQSLIIAGPDHVNLSAWYVNQGDGTPLVILFHGYATEKTSLLHEARIFLELGASVLLVDFRGSGGSSESYTTIGVIEGDDVAAVMQYAKTGLHHSAFILYGQSMGAVAILRAIRYRDVSPDGVILEAVFDTMLNTVCNRFASLGVPSFPSAQLLVFWGGRLWGFNGFSHNPVEYAQAVRCPSLFMHGANDPRAKLAEGRRVFDAVPGPKEFKEFEAIGHESYAAVRPVEWKAAVAALMNKVLNPES